MWGLTSQSGRGGGGVHVCVCVCVRVCVSTCVLCVHSCVFTCVCKDQVIRRASAHMAAATSHPHSDWPW